MGPKPTQGEGGESPKKPEKPEKAKTEEDGKTAKSEAATSGDSEYALPFAWETSTAEPLGQARGFLREVYAANGDYARGAGKLFATSGGDKLGPRATVITCADEGVQAGAFDGSPENDDYMVRNLGNVVENSLGSVEYGVEQLNTPVLLVVGHTGCGAVKAALDGKEALEKLGESVSKEVAKIHVSKKPAGLTLGRAVIDNVRDQVAFSLQKFGRHVHAGRLTVVGAVLDLTNEMGFGAGRLIIVDVNGNHDEKRIAAFNQAVVGGQAFGRPGGHSDTPDHGGPQAERTGAPERDKAETDRAKPEAERAKSDEHAKTEPEHVKPDVEHAKPQEGEHAKPAASEAKDGKAAAEHASAPARPAKRAAERADHGGRGARQAARDDAAAKAREDQAAKALVAALSTLPAARGRLASE